jgi:flagellar hook-associated protein 2
VSLEDATVEHLPSEPIIPAWEAPKEPEIIRDTRFVFLQDEAETIPLPEISDSEAFKTVRISLADYTDNLDSINLRNRDSLRDLEIRNIRIYDPTVRGDYKPVNPLSEARNAILEIDGIEVRRDTNTISDILPGTTLTLHRESSQEVNLSVEPDREGIKNSIIEFVYHYNRLLTELNILTRNNESIVEEITYFGEDEREAALERLGMMQGDSSLRMMQSSLQTALMNAYPTSSDSNIRLLHQIGISTNTQGAAATFNASRLRGYLELNETVFDNALENNLQAVKKLFGSDSDGDMVVDTGAAHAVDTLIRPYVQTGGFIAARVATIEGQVERTNEDISSYNRHLEDYEQRLKEEFGRMEGALESLEESSRTLDSFGQNSGN